MKQGWKKVRLGDVCELRPSKIEARKKIALSAPVSFVPMNSLSENGKDLLLEMERPLGDVIGSYTYFAENDVLLAKITPCFENGKLGVARGLKNGVGFGSSEFMVLRPNIDLDPDYLFYFLRRPDFRTKGAAAMTGAVGHRRVPPEFVQSQLINLPPLEEQRRIAAILDEAFEGIDRAAAIAEQNRANARSLFESRLNAVFSQIRETVYLPEISENLDNRRVPITKSDRISGNIPYYGASGVVDHVKDFIFDEDILLVSEDGANLLMRNYPIAFSVSGKCWVNNHAHILRFNNLYSQKFVELYLNYISIEDFISGAAQPKLNQKSMNSIPIPWPLLKDQPLIVDNLVNFKEETASLSALYESKLSALAELKQAILHQAFTGGLTSDSDKTLAEMGA